PRTRSRWAVHSDVCPSCVAELPCQPHTHVTCCSRCTYWSITCLSGSSVSVADDLGGLGFTDTLLGLVAAGRGPRGGSHIVRHFGQIGLLDVRERRPERVRPAPGTRQNGGQGIAGRSGSGWGKR